MSTCAWPTCNDVATHGEYCFMHYRVYGTKAPKPATAPIPKKSAKAKVEDAALSKLVKELLAKPENKYCKIKIDGCTKIATTMNHTKRRFKGSKLNPKYLEPACSNCNLQIENKDKEARDKGHLQTKYKM
jgi:5-methylcytosine-specific restriction endonuclease McrA